MQHSDRRLQAFFDDSGGKGQGRWMTMSGLFGEAELFASITVEWERHLQAAHPGRIRYFKMDEACQLDGEFSHWQRTSRDAKVHQMAKVIDRGELLEIAARVDLRAFEEVGARWSHVKPKPGDAQKYQTMGQPYMLLCQYVIVTATTEAVERGATTPIEIVFDNQSVFSRSLQASYPELRELEREYPDRLAVLPAQLWFRDDKDVVMLQAADMLAGELRLAAEGYADNPSFIGRLCPRLSVSRHFKDIRSAEMEALHTHITEVLEREEREAEALHKQDGCDAD